VFVLTSLVDYLAGLIRLVLEIYFWIIIARAVLSWVNPDPFNPIVRFLYRVTEPVLRPVRRRMPDLGGLDISPMVVLFAIHFLKEYLVPVLHRLMLSG
jgi:YggT family protein